MFLVRPQQKDGKANSYGRWDTNYQLSWNSCLVNVELSILTSVASEWNRPENAKRWTFAGPPFQLLVFLST
jgi:hypothetical protein